MKLSKLLSPGQQHELMLYGGNQSWEAVSFSGTRVVSFLVEWVRLAYHLEKNLLYCKSTGLNVNHT